MAMGHFAVFFRVVHWFMDDAVAIPGTSIQSV